MDGAGSSWTNSSDFYVGHNGNGTLTISNGGTVSNAVGFVGRYSTSTSTATVDGAGSSWASSSDLLVWLCRQRHADHPQWRRSEQ